MDRKPNYFFVLLLVAGGLLLVWQGGGISLPSISTKPTAVTYVHDEKAAVPTEIYVALAELNAQGIRATAFPDDAADGDDQVPDQYKVTLPAAKAAGIPSLVVQSGERVLRTIKAPTTKAQVLEAAR